MVWKTVTALLDGPSGEHQEEEILDVGGIRTGDARSDLDLGNHGSIGPPSSRASGDCELPR